MQASREGLPARACSLVYARLRCRGWQPGLPGALLGVLVAQLCELGLQRVGLLLDLEVMLDTLCMVVLPCGHQSKTTVSTGYIALIKPPSSPLQSATRIACLVALAFSCRCSQTPWLHAH